MFIQCLPDNSPWGCTYFHIARLSRILQVPKEATEAEGQGGRGAGEQGGRGAEAGGQGGQGAGGHLPPQKLSCGGIAPTKICSSY